MTPPEQGLLSQFIPAIVIGLIYAVVVYVIARKRRINPWGWTIGAAIPIIGMLVAAVFYLLSFLSVLDRLNALEGASKAP